MYKMEMINIFQQTHSSMLQLQQNTQTLNFVRVLI